MKSSRLVLSLLPLAIACADDGDAGKNSLVLTSSEAAGSNCDNGGVKIESGLDANGNAKLEASEVASTEYVCSGDDGAAGQDGLGAEDVTTSVTAATAAQCPDGGQQIQFQNAAGAPTGDPVVVCGASAAQAFGPTPTGRAFRRGDERGVLAGEAFSTLGPANVLTASITIPGSGTIVAMGSSAAYCDSTGTAPLFGKCYDATNQTAAWLTILPVTGQKLFGNSGEAVIQFITPDIDNSISASAQYFVGSAGTYTYALVGMATDTDNTGTADGPVESQVYYGTSSFTLIFIPH